MKEGIVLEIRHKKAAVLKPDGNIIAVTAGKDWKIGDLVSLKEAKKPIHQKGYAIAACLAFFFLLTFTGYRQYYNPQSVVSLDVNPSIELEINRFNRIVSVHAYNKEGEKILEHNPVVNWKLDAALEQLFTGGLSFYLKDSPYVAFSIQSGNTEAEKKLKQEIVAAAELILKTDANTGNVQVEYYEVDEETLEYAHSHHITAGKYKILQELQEVYPEMELEEYSHCSVGELKEQIQECNGKHGHGSQQTEPEGEEDAEEGIETESKTDMETEAETGKETDNYKENTGRHHHGHGHE